MSRHVLPPLPYDYAALQPWIDEQTMRVHHDCHHRACVDRLNDVEARLAVARESGDFALIRHLQQVGAVYTAEHELHSLFWESMGPNQGGYPRDELAAQLAQDFGSFVTFKTEFCGAATSLEDGGWVVLAWQRGGDRLSIIAADSYQLQTEWVRAAVLALDMCEHAHYLKYQDRRAEYAHNWWNTVNWPTVSRRLATMTYARPGPIRPHFNQRSSAERRHPPCPTDSH